MKILTRVLVLLLALMMVTGTFAGCIVKIPDNPLDDPKEPGNENPEGPGNENPGKPKYDLITVARALELCGEEAGEPTAERYYIKATVVSIDNPTYGQMTISDETGSIPVWGTYSADGSIRYDAMEEKPYKGDTVILHCTLQNYNGKKEVQNARLIELERGKVEVNEADYTAMTVAAAREAAEGTKIKLTGVVAQITYANGLIPSGIYVVDNTQSIYVYDGDIAARAAIGDTVTVLGSKAYWVLENEQSNAEKFGYQGCCQLEEAKLVSIEKTNADFDKSWIGTSTVKAILDTPVTENITTTIYKVTALVKEKPGNGFTNFYFYDLDGTTGSYAYSQCNGNDFEWLRAFDGKICTVYLSAINAKSTSTSCFFRLLPVAVIDENFTFDLEKTAEHVVEYYGLPQFNAQYTGNPAMELVTTVSSELLGFTGATLSYTSSNEAVVYFTTENGKTIFNCGESGKATVTVTGTHNGKTFANSVEITVAENLNYDSITVADAIAKPVGEIVILEGIIGPSLVNRDGFYFFDETGMVAVVVKDTALFGEIEIGQRVVITGKRDCFKDADKTHAGQIAISGVEVLANYYGNHNYPTDGFITDKDLAFIRNLDNNEDHSTEVYVVKATVSVVETPFYTSIKLTHNGTDLSLYCSGANQYSFLKQFAGQEVTLEIAPCNWNNKTYYAGCVLAVRLADGSKVLNTLNFNK